MKRVILSDSDHPLVVNKSIEITANVTDDKEKVQRIFNFVRDDIKFGFPLNGDLVKASETIASGVGQCNTKSTLFLSLCKALNIQARIHFSTIKKEIQRGLFTGIAYKLMPDLISHSWVEVYIEDKWIRIDSFINDINFYAAGKKRLLEKGWETGYSISCAKGDSSPELNLVEEKFVQMGAVMDDHGVWDEPMDYYMSALYRNRPGFIKLMMYRLFIKSINNKVSTMRKNCCKNPTIDV